VRLPRRPIHAEIPTAPMADLAFLLMLFFVVTAVFSATRGLELKLPTDQEQDASQAKGAIFIRINPDASIVVDCKPMRSEELLDYLEPVLRNDPETAVVLYTDPFATYQAMISVYDVLVSARATRGFEVQNVTVPTQTEVQEYKALFGMEPFESRCGSR
jgi:biopolymer transport protein ExbD